MKPRRVLSMLAVVALVASIPGAAGAAQDAGRGRPRFEGGPPDGFVPAVARQASGRYFVTLRQPSVAAAGARAPGAQRRIASRAVRSQRVVANEARSLGGRVLFSYRVLVNGFSAELTPGAASTLAGRSDVQSVEPVPVVQRLNSTSVPFIGAGQVWNRFKVRGEGMRVAVVDTGIDYTHRSFGGPGTVAAYTSNNPTVIERGSFPTRKVIGGIDLVGENYDVLDDDTSNDTPVPDRDPLDEDGHGSHTAGTCCGFKVGANIGPGVAPRAKLYAVKVWDEGNSTADVLVAGYEFAVDPNGDGKTKDRVDVLSFSGGVDYGTQSSTEAVAAQRVVDLGTVFVASAGNAGNQVSGFSAYITGTPANAPGVVSVAASIDEFQATQITVNSPPVTLPDNGIMVHQPWSAPLPAGGITSNLFDGRAVDAATTNPADQQFCAPLPGGSLSGRVVVVYKGSTGSGDCDGELKVDNAAAAGATAVVLVSLFGGLPFSLAGDSSPIPAVMVSGADGQAILDALSPSPPPFNSQTVNATLGDDPAPIPGFDDAMTDFTSEGPARVTSALKPDISAPGFDITSALVGSGNRGTESSGTSMAAPHVSGVATLLRQLHPKWSPERIKALLMNQAKPQLKNNDLTQPVPATVMGAGRVRAIESAKAVSLASPASLSFGLQATPRTTDVYRSFTVKNLDRTRHKYKVTPHLNYADFDASVVEVQLARRRGKFRDSLRFSLKPGRSQKVAVRLTVDPGPITEADQELGWYYFHPNMDGAVLVEQSRHGSDFLRVPWHVAPLAASDDRMSKGSLGVASGPDTMSLVSGAAAGVSYADLYLLGGADPADAGGGEQDVRWFGARSFTGRGINGIAEGVPTGTDELGGFTWIEYLTDADEPTEPVEFVVATEGLHNVSETKEVDILIDADADGVFADTDLRADYMIVKLPAPGGETCVYDLSLPSPFDACTHLYFADYSNYNTDVTGLVVDASAIGLGPGHPRFSYSVTACTQAFAGDVVTPLCDEAGGFAGGTYTARFNAAAPALDIAPMTCRGFWDGPACDGGSPVTVTDGSAPAGADPSILAVFPNNAPGNTTAVITTDNG